MISEMSTVAAGAVDDEAALGPPLLPSLETLVSGSTVESPLPDADAIHILMLDP